MAIICICPSSLTVLELEAVFFTNSVTVIHTATIDYDIRYNFIICPIVITGKPFSSWVMTLHRVCWASGRTNRGTNRGSKICWTSSRADRGSKLCCGHRRAHCGANRGTSGLCATAISLIPRIYSCTNTRPITSW